MINPGKFLRAPFLYQTNVPIIIAPIDDLLIFGPHGGLENPSSKIRDINEAGVDAILTFCGSLKRNPAAYANVCRFVNLSASTVHSAHTRKVKIHSVEEAIRVGATGIAYHINVTSKYAGEMISAASEVIAEADRFGIPTLGIIYPRGERGGLDNNYDDLKKSDPSAFAGMIAHCTALGADLGFDIIKTMYTDNSEMFRSVVRSADGVPVVIAGGPLDSFENALDKARGALAGGASGISFGRNLFGRSVDLTKLVTEIRRLPRL
ncbi:DhnA family fructose-bisphosphate aldolase class Ia [Bradyrhizobium japonicum]